MALIKPEQLRSGSYNITGSFSGSFYGDGSNLNNLPIPSIDTGSLVTTSSFNSFTSSYYADSGSFSTRVTNLENFSSSLNATFATEAELNAATSSLSASIANLSSSFEIFSGSYNTGSFTGSFVGDLIGTASYTDNANSASYASTASYIENAQTASYVSASNVDGTVTSASYALTASYLEGYIPPFPYTGSAEITGSLSVTGSTSLYNSGSTILSVNGPQGEIFSVTDDLTGDLFIIQSGSTDLFVVSSSGDTTISGSLTVTNGITASLYGTASWAENSLTASYVSASNIDGTVTSASYALTASYIENAQTASYVLNAVSASHALTASYVNTLNQDVLITGSLTVLQGATIYGSSSFTYVTASQLAVSASFISVNVFEPVQRFGGLIVYDSGSSLATASLAWDSLHNHWVYQNVDGATYTGGMFLSGPRNTGSLGDEPTLTKWFVPRSDGTDHLENSQIYSSGSATIVTGSLTVTGGVTGSFTGSYVGDGSGLYNIPSTGIVGLNLSQIASGSATASISPNGLNVNTNTQITGSLAVTGGVTVGVSGSNSQISFPNTTSGFVNFMRSEWASNRFRIDLGGSSVQVTPDSCLLSPGGASFLVSAGLHQTTLKINNIDRFVITGSSGTNTSYFTNTNLLVGTTLPTGHRFVVSGSSTSGSVNLDNTLYVSGSRVGIGTSTPSVALDITGAGRSSGTLTSLSQLISQTGTNSGRMSLLNLRNTGGGYTSAVNSSMAIAFTNRDTTNVWSDDFIELKVYNSGSTTTRTGYNFYTHNNQLFSAASVLAMSINGQNVGIGTETPNTRLDVSGSAIITGSLTVTQGITGSLFGTASWAENATTASYVQTAQTASYVLNAVSASYASFAVTASYIDGGFY
jgi:hypothetical protein